MEDLLRLKDKIWEHNLGDKKEAYSLYKSLCSLLKEKYGLVDKDYDENPTKRGKEWLDIHHVLEYQLDDIARRTQFIKSEEKKAVWVKENEIFYYTIEKDIYYFIKKTENYDEEYEKIKDFQKKYKDGNFGIYTFSHTLEDLKLFNRKERLVYANKIEHFLLHYLIDSIRGQKMFSGGPNYMWDAAVALDVYAFDMEHLNVIQKNKNEYYSYIDSEEITLLYKKLIEWKKWDIEECKRYWINYKNVFSKYEQGKVSYFTNIKKLKQLLQIIGIHLDKLMVDNIDSLPLKERILKDAQGNIKFRIINEHWYEEDRTTLHTFGFNLYSNPSAITVPKNVIYIKEKAFDSLIVHRSVEKIKIPQNVKFIEDRTFVYANRNEIVKKFKNLKQLIYTGSKEEWESKFANVILKDIELICKE